MLPLLAAPVAAPVSYARSLAPLAAPARRPLVNHSLPTPPPLAARRAPLTACRLATPQAHYVLAAQFCEGASGCEEPLSACEAFGCNSDYPSARYTATTVGVDPKLVDLTTGVPSTPRPDTTFDNPDTPTQSRGPNGHVADAEEQSATEGIGPTEPPGFQVLLEPLAQPQAVVAERFGR